MLWEIQKEIMFSRTLRYSSSISNNRTEASKKNFKNMLCPVFNMVHCWSNFWWLSVPDNLCLYIWLLLHIYVHNIVTLLPPDFKGSVHPNLKTFPLTCYYVLGISTVETSGSPIQWGVGALKALKHDIWKTQQHHVFPQSLSNPQTWLQSKLKIKKKKKKTVRRHVWGLLGKSIWVCNCVFLVGGLQLFCSCFKINGDTCKTKSGRQEMDW